MDKWLFALQLGAIVSVIVLTALWTVNFALRAGRSDAEPLIKATGKELSKGCTRILPEMLARA